MPGAAIRWFRGGQAVCLWCGRPACIGSAALVQAGRPHHKTRGAGRRKSRLPGRPRAGSVARFAPPRGTAPRFDRRRCPRSIRPRAASAGTSIRGWTCSAGPTSATPPRSCPSPPASVLVVLDGSGQDACSVPLAAHLKARFGCELAVADARETDAAADACERAAADLSAAPMPRTEGESYEQILAAVDRSGCDLLITPCPFGREPESVGPHSAGLTTDMLLARCPVPMLVVRQPFPVAPPAAGGGAGLAVRQDRGDPDRGELRRPHGPPAGPAGWSPAAGRSGWNCCWSGSSTRTSGRS